MYDVLLVALKMSTPKAAHAQDTVERVMQQPPPLALMVVSIGVHAHIHGLGV